MARGKIEAKKRVFDKQSARQVEKLDACLAQLDALPARLHNIVASSGLGCDFEFSGKAEALLVLLERLKAEHEEEVGSGRLRCMVFVEQVATTYPLAEIINQRLNGREALPFSGRGSMSDRDCKKNLQLFDRGEVGIIVATNALEEGIDVHDCKVVIRFDVFHNVKSHVQGAGRARHPNARIYYFDNDPDVAMQDAARMQDTARMANVETEQVADTKVTGRGVASATESCPFVQPSTGAQLTASNCLSILYEYVARVLRETVDPKQLFIYEEAAAIIGCRVPTPKGEVTILKDEVATYWRKARGLLGSPSLSDFRELVEAEGLDVQWTDVAWERRRFAYVAAVRLMEKGFIDDHNLPSPEAISDTSEHSEGFFLPNENVGKVRVHFNPKSLTCPKRRVVTASSLTGNDRPSINTGVCLLQATYDERAMGAAIGAGVGDSAAGAMSMSSRSGLAQHLNANSVGAELGVHLAGKEDTQVLANAKGALNEHLQECLGRTLLKGDVDYSTAAVASKFKSTVSLAPLLDRYPGAQVCFEGELCTTKKEAEQSAASRAVRGRGGWKRGGCGDDSGGGTLTAPQGANPSAAVASPDASSSVSTDLHGTASAEAGRAVGVARDLVAAAVTEVRGSQAPVVSAEAESVIMGARQGSQHGESARDSLQLSTARGVSGGLEGDGADQSGVCYPVDSAASGQMVQSLVPNPKCELNERLMVLLGRPLRKSGDVDYDTVPCGESQLLPNFVSTVSLPSLTTKYPELQWSFSGEAANRKKDAEQNAAQHALRRLSVVLTNGNIPAPGSGLTSGIAAAPHAELNASTLQSVVSADAVTSSCVQLGHDAATEATGPDATTTHAEESMEVQDGGIDHGANGASVNADDVDLDVVDDIVKQPPADSTVVGAPSCIADQVDASFEAASTGTAIQDRYLHIRTWCEQNSFPPELLQQLEEEDVQQPDDLSELSDADLDGFCAKAGVKVGVKGRFKIRVKALRMLA